MANRDAPSGFRVLKHLSGGMPNRMTRYHIASGLAANIFRNDVVVPTGTGKNIARPAAGTDRPIGVFDGCYYADQTGDMQYRPNWPSGQVILTGSVVDANVYDDPNLIFEGQMSGAFVAGDIGALTNYTVGTGNSAQALSGDEVDSTAIGSGSSLKILDVSSKPDNEVGANARVHVTFATHYLAGAKTGI